MRAGTTQPLDGPESKLRPPTDPGSPEGSSNDRANKKPHGAHGPSSGSRVSLIELAVLIEIVAVVAVVLWLAVLR